jgi:hypothetical protein
MADTAPTPSAPAPNNAELLALAKTISAQLAKIEKNTVPPPPSGMKAIKAAAKEKAKALKEARDAKKKGGGAAAAAGGGGDDDDVEEETYDKYTEWDAKNMCFCLGCASAACKCIPFCGSRIATGVKSGYKCHVRLPCSCPKCSCPKCKIPCLCCLKCTTIGCECPFGCLVKKCNCCHITCGCFPILLYPVAKLVCCANFEKIDDNQNVGKPLKDAHIQEVEIGVVPQSAVMERGGNAADA